MEQLSGLDASFLYMETPHMHLHVAMCAVLDASAIPEDARFEAIRGYVAERIHLLAPFRRRLVEVPFHLDHPYWLDEPDVDLLHHVRRARVAAPGGMRELGALVGRIASSPLARNRPLWELWVLEGLPEGRVGLLAKLHHSAVDGATGAGLLVNLFSMSPEPKAPKPAAPRDPEPIPADVELLKTAVASRLRQPRRYMDLAKTTATRIRDVALLRRAPKPTTAGFTLSAPRTRFNGSIGTGRLAAFARVGLGELKAIKREVPGAKLNDVILTLAAGAIRRYLLAHDDLPDEPLVVTVPISTGLGGRGNNHVSFMMVPLATQMEDPRLRLQAVARATRSAKREHEAIGGEMLQSWAELAAPNTVSAASALYGRMRLADRHRPVHNLTISNVPGPPFPIYLAGARLEAAYPMGPVLEGSGLNLTVMSYCGSVDFGFMAARNLMPDVAELAEEVVPALEELQAAFGRPTEARA
ncbi:MAG: wax ester/triacylglycerol synthase family O-acyltransferase [Myxococcota bacterium]